MCSGFCFQCYFLNVILLTRELVCFRSKQWFSTAGSFGTQGTFGDTQDVFACHSGVGGANDILWVKVTEAAACLCQLSLCQTFVFTHALTVFLLCARVSHHGTIDISCWVILFWEGGVLSCLVQDWPIRLEMVRMQYGNYFVFLHHHLISAVLRSLFFFFF